MKHVVWFVWAFSLVVACGATGAPETALAGPAVHPAYEDAQGNPGEESQVVASPREKMAYSYAHSRLCVQRAG